MKKLAFLLLCLIYLKLDAQTHLRTYLADENLVPPEHAVDFTHLKLEIEFDTLQGKVTGTVSHAFKVLRKEVDSIYLDGPGIEVHSMKLDKKDTRFSTDAKGITVYFEPALHWDEQHQLEIAYSAVPEKGIYFIGWNDTTRRSRRQVWTQGQGFDNRHWIPMFDYPNDKVTTEMIVHFAQQYKVLSNGTKVSEKHNKDGTTTWHYVLKKPHPTYLIMLGIGDYAIREARSKSGVPLQMWYYPDWKNRVDATYKYTVDMMDFLERETGVPYPWDKYAQIPVQDFMYGAMENTTATIFGDFYCTDERGFWDRNYVRVNAHEMAHQWFGNMVSARTNSHQWLQESFATHYDLTYQGIAFGEDHFNWERRKAQTDALKASESDYKPIAHSAAGSTRHYPKGAHVLQMLKYVVGHEAFNRTVQHYLQKHAYGNVDSEDFLVAFHETLGLSLDWFWEEWIYKGGEPHYEVSFREMETNDHRYGAFDVKQVHERNELVGLFDMPVVFEVHYADGSKSSTKVRIDEEQEEVLIPLEKGKKVSYALFDPNSEVMKKLTFEKPVEMLKQQALLAPHMIDRYDAVDALNSTPLAEKRATLHKVYEKESFHVLKEEILSQLLYDPESRELVKSALTGEDPLVRKAVAQKTGYIPNELLPYYEKLLNDSSYETIEVSLEKLCFLFPENCDRYLETTEGDTGIFAKNIRVKWLEISYNKRKEQAYVDELIDYTSPSYEFRTRVNAAEALMRLNYFNEALMKNLIQSQFSFNYRLRSPMAGVLDHFYQQTAYRKMIYDHIRSGQYSGKELARLKKFMQF